MTDLVQDPVHYQTAPHATPLSSSLSSLQLSALVFAVIAGLLVTQWNSLLNDPDTYWHIEIGRWIVANRAVPTTDLWSHTFAGQPWIAKEWLSQVLLERAYSFGGWRGVAVATIIAFAGTLAGIAYWLQQRLQPRYVWCAVAAIFMLSVGSILARPHVIVLPVVVVWTLGLLSQLEKAHTPPWWLLIVMVVWANMHAGFTIGFVIAFFIGLQAIINAGKDWFKTGLAWAGFGILALGASCVGPYGIGPYLVTLKLFGTTESISRIDEWQALQLDPHGIASLVILGAILIGLATRLPRHIALFGLIAIVGVMMIQHLRFGMLFAVIALPVAALPLAQRFPRLARSEATTQTARIWLAPALAAGLGLAAFFTPPPAPPQETSPLAALRAARAAGLTGNVYNNFEFSGFLISQQVATYIDGRTDQLFLDGFIARREQQIMAPKPDALIRQLDASKVTWALIRASDPEFALLKRAGWRTIYQDGVATVLKRP